MKSLPSFRRDTAIRATTAALLGFTALPLWADTIALWNFAGSLPGDQLQTPVTSFKPGMGATSLTRGSGVTPSASGGTMSSSGWAVAVPPTGILDPNDYYEFGLTLGPGDVLDLDTIHFSERRSGTGIRKFALRSSKDNYAADIVTPIAVDDNTNNRDQSISLPPAFDAQMGNITFRLYGFDAEGPAGTWRLQNHSVQGGLKIEGTYTPGTPPGSITVELTPSTIAENAGAGAVTGKVKLNAVTPTDVIVNVSSSDTSEAVLPPGGATITVTQGTDEATFSLDIVDDSIFDGSVAVSINATALGYNPGSGTLMVTDHGDTPTLIINEVLADPDTDVNGNGILPETSSGADDEYIEFVNISPGPLDISGWTIHDSGSLRHTFPPATNLATGQAIVVFGGNTGLPASINGALVQGATAATGGLAMNNAGDTMTLKDALGVTRDIFTFGSEGGFNQSLTRSPDLTGAFVQHSTAAGAVGNFSLGVKIDGTPFAGTAYAAWIDGFYPGNADPGTIGFLADPDGDGMVNGLEASMGTSPNDAQSVARLLPTSALPGVVSFDQPKSRTFLTDVISMVEWSTDLQNWQQSGVAYGGVNVLLSQTSVDTSGPSYDVVKGTGVVIDGTPERIYVRVIATKTSP